MGLEQVIGDVRREAETRAEAILAEAKEEAKRILSDAEAKVAAYASKRSAQAEKDAAQAAAQIASNAEFEARKSVLKAEAELRKELRARILADMARLPADARKAHVQKLVVRAQSVIPEGTLQCNEQDAQNAEGYAVGAPLDIAGGIVVESADGSVRVDLSYETLLGDAWRDVLKQEAGLFQ